jgi:hypothetical protein
MIALCNKAIKLDVSHLPGAITSGIAARSIAFSVAYFVLRPVNN